MPWARWLLPVPGRAEEEPFVVLGDEAAGGELEGVEGLADVLASGIVQYRCA
jgi:hypothetical protein